MPSGALNLKDFSVNGHRLSFEGELVVAFRVDDRSALTAFAGHNCQKISINEREFVFANQPVALAAWAPVLPARRVPGGAILEVWVQGEAEMSLPLPAGVEKGELYFQGSRVGSFGEKIVCECAGGVLRFKTRNDWGQRHLFFVPG